MTAPDRLMTYQEIYRNLDGLIALAVAERTVMRVKKGETHTEFVKRIVASYVELSQMDRTEVFGLLLAEA